jgi:hypothetical protein
MKVNFGEHILFFFLATKLNCMKTFGDFLNFWWKFNEEKSEKQKVLGLLIFSLVPNVYPKVFAIAPWFYFIWFSPKFNSHVYNLKRWARGEYIFLYFATGVQKDPSIGECSMFQKNWWWATEYGSFKKKKKLCAHP